MADIGFIRYGAWHGMKHALDAGRLKEDVRTAIGGATAKAALYVRGRIRKRIQSGTAYGANSKLTIMIKHSSKPLVGRGADLFNSIATKTIDWRSAFVGVLRGTMVDGKDMVNIAEVVHEGLSIRVTDKMHGMFQALYKVGQGEMSATELHAQAAEMAKALGDEIKNIRPLKRSTKVIIIPTRQFIAEVFKDPTVIKHCQAIWKKAAAATLAGQPKGGTNEGGSS